MNISAHQLEQRLNTQLDHVYTLSGNSTLLIQEAATSIINKAKAAGFSLHTIITIDKSFDWHDLMATISEMDMFHEKRILDIRNPSNKHTAKLFNKLSTHHFEHQIILFRFSKLTQAQIKSAWYKSLMALGCGININMPTPDQMPICIIKRAKRYKLSIASNHAYLLSEYCISNLLACDQALKKARLLGYTNINESNIPSIISNNAQYTVFDLADAMLTGEFKQSYKLLTCLLTQGVEPVLILWSLAKVMRELYTMQYELNMGKPASSVLSKVWSTKKKLYQRALQRLPLKILSKQLTQLTLIDQMIKGIKPGSVELAFKDILRFTSQDKKNA